MRVGLLTFHRPINYGAFLQAFSLSVALQREFPEDQVEVIDYIAPKEKRKIWLNVLRDAKYSGCGEVLRSLKKISVFRNSQKCLHRSSKYLCGQSLDVLYSYIQENYDLLVIGSDAVFNWNQNGFPTAFIPDYDFGIPVLTYAASIHGLRYYEEPQARIKLCRNAFQKMHFIGVRDACTEQFVKWCLPDATPRFCCDPTLFIDTDQIRRFAGDYKTRISKKYGVHMDEPYIVLMVPDSELIRAIREKYGKEYRLFSLFKNSTYADYYLFDLNPFEWAMVLNGAAATVTSYFHGALLSLVQGTPAVVLDYSGYDCPYQGKLLDLMKTRLNLSSFYFTKEEAEHFQKQESFYALFDDMLKGNFADIIQEGVQNCRSSFDAFKQAIIQTKM